MPKAILLQHIPILPGAFVKPPETIPLNGSILCAIGDMCMIRRLAYTTYKAGIMTRKWVDLSMRTYSHPPAKALPETICLPIAEIIL